MKKGKFVKNDFEADENAGRASRFHEVIKSRFTLLSVKQRVAELNEHVLRMIHLRNLSPLFEQLVNEGKDLPPIK